MATSQRTASTALARSPRFPALARFFRKLPDPRRPHGQRHRLLDLIYIALCAVICGADDWHDIATFAEHRRDWLSRFLKLPHGVPSHDTFARIFARLDPVAFQRCFQEWVAAIAALLKCHYIAIDGKALRGSAGPLGPLHVVSAWAREHHLVLGQVAVDGDSNEITAIPKILELIDVEGAMVTIDAIGCQKEIAQRILDRGGDYLLTAKGNQPTLKATIQATFEEAIDTDYAGLQHDTYTSQERGHWSIENNLHWQLDVSFSEDQNRVRERRAAENLALVRRLTLMLLKRHPARLSLARKRYAAALDTTFLEEILCGKT